MVCQFPSPASQGSVLELQEALNYWGLSDKTNETEACIANFGETRQKHAANQTGELAPPSGQLLEC